MRECNLTDISLLSELPNLSEIVLSSNEIVEIPANLSKSIVTMELDNNKITSIENLELYPELIDLYLQNNQIETLPKFDKNEKLILLEVGNNEIKEFPYSIIKSNYNRMKDNKFDIHIYENPFLQFLNLNPEGYELINDWGYVNGLSGSKSLLRDYHLLTRN